MTRSDKVSNFTSSLEGKTIIVDTSSLLSAGVSLLKALPECTLVIPTIVTTELESKRGHHTLGFMAREWLRLIEDLRCTAGRDLLKGVKIPDADHVTLRIERNNTNQEKLPAELRNGSNDSIILSVANNLALEAEKNIKGSSENFVLMSNDVPMRIATLSLEGVKLSAVEYSTTLSTGKSPFSGIVGVEFTEEDEIAVSGENADLCEYLYDKSMEVDSRTENLIIRLTRSGGGTNEYFVRGRNQVTRLRKDNDHSNIGGRSHEQHAALEYLSRSAQETPIVSIAGSAGTGKTLLSIAVGLSKVAAGEYQRFIVFRSLHEMGVGQEVGFLPGSLEDKMASWAGAVWDSVEVIASNSGGSPNAVKGDVETLKANIEVSPITYLRGRSLANSYIILEEAQNFNRNEILNILSRVGEGSKIVLTFDSAQVDNRFLQAGNKADVWSVVEVLRDREEFAHVSLKKTERSVVADIAAGILEN